MARYQIDISSDRMAAFQANPAWSGGLVEQPAEDGQIFWTLDLLDGMTFTKTDYEKLNTLKELENGIGEEISITISKICTSTTTAIWEGKFTLLNADHDRDRCQFVVQPTPKNLASKLLENYEVKQNIFLLATVVAKASSGTYEVKCCKQDKETVNLGDSVPPTFTSCISDPSDYCATPESNDVFQETKANGETVPVRQTCLHRFIAEGTCNGSTPQPPAGTGWTLLQNNCPSNAPTYWRCPTTADFSEGIVDLEHGRDFNAAIEYLVGQIDNTLTVVSNFFGINPDASAPANDAYQYATDYLQALTIHQKSDVKRPEATNPATSPGYEIDLKSLFDDLAIMLNVYWDIILDVNDNPILRLEHHSFFENTDTPLDIISLDRWAKTQGKGVELKKYEIWEWMDPIDETSNNNKRITYPVGEGSETYQITNFSTNLARMQNTFNAEAYSDKGFALVSNRKEGNNYIIAENNAGLFLENLIDKLHRHNRLYPKFTHRTLEKDAITWQPLETQNPINGAWCCDELPIGKSRVTTKIGTGTLEKIEYNIKNDSVIYYPQF